MRVLVFTTSESVMEIRASEATTGEKNGFAFGCGVLRLSNELNVFAFVLLYCVYLPDICYGCVCKIHILINVCVL